MRPQYLVTAWNASCAEMDRFVRLLHLLENRVRLTGGVNVARQDQHGMLFAVAVAAAVTMLQAPGPTEEVHAKMPMRRICLA